MAVAKTVANCREYHFRWTDFLFDKYNSLIVTIKQLLCIHYFNKQARRFSENSHFFSNRGISEKHTQSYS